VAVGLHLQTSLLMSLDAASDKPSVLLLVDAGPNPPTDWSPSNVHPITLHRALGPNRARDERWMNTTVDPLRASFRTILNMPRAVRDPDFAPSRREEIVVTGDGLLLDDGTFAFFVPLGSASTPAPGGRHGQLGCCATTDEVHGGVQKGKDRKLLVIDPPQASTVCPGNLVSGTQARG